MADYDRVIDEKAGGGIGIDVQALLPAYSELPGPGDLRYAALLDRLGGRACSYTRRPRNGRQDPFHSRLVCRWRVRIGKHKAERHHTSLVQAASCFAMAFPSPLFARE